MGNLSSHRTFHTAILASAVGCLTLSLGCPRSGLYVDSYWQDDEGRQIYLFIEGDPHSEGNYWIAHWAEPQTCPVNGIARPRERFRLWVDKDGQGTGTIAICRYGFEECVNGPATAFFEAQVTPGRIQGTVFDQACNEYQGTEIFRRTRCRPRPPTEYLESTTPLAWKEESSEVESSGRLVFRAPKPERTAGELQVWAISPVDGQLVSRAPTGALRFKASDGEVYYAFQQGETLVSDDEEISDGTRLARLEATGSDQLPIFELQVLGFTPDGESTDPHCVRGW